MWVWCEEDGCGEGVCGDEVAWDEVGEYESEIVSLVQEVI